MDNHSEEQYVFRRAAIADFEQAAISLHAASRYKRTEVRCTLIRDAIISYSRPFSSNAGVFQKKGLSLKTNDIVPRDMRKLHNDIVEIRNQIVAHTDINWSQPTLIKSKTEKDRIFVVVKRGFFPEELLTIANPLKELIEIVKTNLETETRRLGEKLTN